MRFVMKIKKYNSLQTICLY